MARKKTSQATTEWEARIKCTVTKIVTLSGCTEAEARSNPWTYATGDEEEVSMSDWEVESCRPNE